MLLCCCRSKQFRNIWIPINAFDLGWTLFRGHIIANSVCVVSIAYRISTELIWEWSHKEVTVTTTLRQRILIRHVWTHCIHQSNTMYSMSFSDPSF